MNKPIQHLLLSPGDFDGVKSMFEENKDLEVDCVDSVSVIHFCLVVFAFLFEFGYSRDLVRLHLFCRQA